MKNWFYGIAAGLLFLAMVYSLIQSTKSAELRMEAEQKIPRKTIKGKTVLDVDVSENNKRVSVICTDGTTLVIETTRPIWQITTK